MIQSKGPPAAADFFRGAKARCSVVSEVPGTFAISIQGRTSCAWVTTIWRDRSGSGRSVAQTRAAASTLCPSGSRSSTPSRQKWRNPPTRIWRTRRSPWMAARTSLAANRPSSSAPLPVCSQISAATIARTRNPSSESKTIPTARPTLRKAVRRGRGGEGVRGGSTAGSDRCSVTVGQFLPWSERRASECLAQGDVDRPARLVDAAKVTAGHLLVVHRHGRMGADRRRRDHWVALGVEDWLRGDVLGIRHPGKVEADGPEGGEVAQPEARRDLQAAFAYWILGFILHPACFSLNLNVEIINNQHPVTTQYT